MLYKIGMDIKFHGFSCFSISGKNAAVVIDPYKTEQSGLKLPKMKTDAVFANKDFPQHYGLENVECPMEHIFDWPGEYEAGGINVMAISAFDKPKSETEKGARENKVLVFVFEVDGFKMCHLSNIGHKLTPEMVENIGDIDILFVPVGGHGVCLDSEKAHEVIEQLEPRMVIPMYYAVPGSKIKLASLEEFLKEVGLKNPKRENTLRLKAKTDLPQTESTEYVVLEPVLR